MESSRQLHNEVSFFVAQAMSLTVIQFSINSQTIYPQ